MPVVLDPDAAASRGASRKPAAPSALVPDIAALSRAAYRPSSK